MARVRISLDRETAVLDGQDRRHCASCGDFIDPKDYDVPSAAAFRYIKRKLKLRVESEDGSC